MKKLASFLAMIFLCTLFLCACQPKEQPADQIQAIGTVAGLIDNHTVEIILEDGTVQSFLFYDEAVAEKINNAEESGALLNFTHVKENDQQLSTIVAAE